MLIPGGEFEMGPDSEGTLDTVVLDAYFIAKQELSTLQLVLLSKGRETLKPERESPATNRNLPEFEDVLRCHGLGIPSEAQWERAARGMNRSQLVPDGDRYDVRVYEARRNSYRLQGLFGGVAEWCSDHWVRYSQRAPDGDGRRVVPQGRVGVVRDGWSGPRIGPPSYSARRRMIRTGRDVDVGARPVRKVY